MFNVCLPASVIDSESSSSCDNYRDKLQLLNIQSHSELCLPSMSWTHRTLTINWPRILLQSYHKTLFPRLRQPPTRHRLPCCTHVVEELQGQIGWHHMPSRKEIRCSRLCRKWMDLTRLSLRNTHFLNIPARFESLPSSVHLQTSKNHTAYRSLVSFE